jgi:perosamine synthetase
MVCTNNSKLAKKIFKLKMVGVVKNKYYWHDIIGYNYRMTNICAAIGYAQLLNSKKILKKKELIFKNYKQFLKGTDLLSNYESKDVKSSFWLINIFVKSKKIRDGLANYLKKNGIETRTTFNPVHLMPMFKKLSSSKLPNSIILSETGLSLPSGANLKKKEIKIICKLIKAYLL